MNIYQAVETRRSVREYREDPILDDALKRIMGAAALAPSAENSQEYKFIIVRNKDKRKALSRAANGQKFVATAPIIIAAVSLNSEAIMDCGVPQYPVDVAIAVDHITLAAVEEGLGTCWIGAFNQDEVKSILNIPEQYKVVVLLTLGVPYEEPSPKSKKSLAELVCREEFIE